MITIWAIIGICLILAGIGKAAMDVIRFDFAGSVFPNTPWFNPSGSWRNKWKNGDPAQGERFLGSSTVFVFVTDFWHFAQFIYMRLMFAVIVLVQLIEPIYGHWTAYLVEYLAASALFGLTFSLFYSKIFLKCTD